MTVLEVRAAARIGYPKLRPRDDAGRRRGRWAPEEALIGVDPVRLERAPKVHATSLGVDRELREPFADYSRSFCS